MYGGSPAGGKCVSESSAQVLGPEASQRLQQGQLQRPNAGRSGAEIRGKLPGSDLMNQVCVNKQRRPGSCLIHEAPAVCSQHGKQLVAALKNHVIFISSVVCHRCFQAWNVGMSSLDKCAGGTMGNGLEWADLFPEGMRPLVNTPRSHQTFQGQTPWSTWLIEFRPVHGADGGRAGLFELTTSLQTGWGSGRIFFF